MATQVQSYSDAHLTATDDDVDVRVLPDESFLAAAVSFKDEVVDMTWRNTGGKCVDPTVYAGLMGTTFACWRAYVATGDERDLVTAGMITENCAAVARRGNENNYENINFRRGVSFLCGRAGVYALGAVIAQYRNDKQQRDAFLDLYFEVAKEKALPVGPEEGGLGMSYELLHGRAGFLWSALFINKHLRPDTVPQSLLSPIVEAVLSGGRAGAMGNKNCPLMFRWHGTRYCGAAHGLAGIMQVLLHFPLSTDDLEDVKVTLKYMIRNRFSCSGNYPSTDGNHRDKLVQWAHGAGGIAITLCKAAQVFADDREFYNAAVEAGEVVWLKGLIRKPGLANGISGNAYVFLSLYRLTGDKLYLERAKSFASFLYYNARKITFGGHSIEDVHSYSLFEGLAGTACLWFDIVSPENSRFPGFEI